MDPLFTEQWSHAPLLRGNHNEKQQNCCFSKPVVQQLKLVDPTNKNHFFLCYQTLKYVVAGEPHPQPHYQTAS
jgi:hypothetical protein